MDFPSRDENCLKYFTQRSRTRRLTLPGRNKILQEIHPYISMQGTEFCQIGCNWNGCKSWTQEVIIYGIIILRFLNKTRYHFDCMSLWSNWKERGYLKKKESRRRNRNAELYYTFLDTVEISWNKYYPYIANFTYDLEKVVQILYLFQVT